VATAACQLAHCWWLLLGKEDEKEKEEDDMWDLCVSGGREATEAFWDI